MLGHRVDLVLADAVKPPLRGGILGEVIRAEIEAEHEWEPAIANQENALDRLQDVLEAIDQIQQRTNLSRQGRR